MRLIIEANQLPPGTTVCKPTGKKPYMIRTVIRIHKQPDPIEITAEPGTLFLVGNDGEINAVSALSQVAVDGSADDIINLLYWVTENKR